MADKKIRRGNRIAFRAIDDFTGQEFTPIGDVIGFGKEIRKKYPVEYEEAPDNMILVKSVDHGNFYIVDPSEVLGKIKPKQLINLKAKRTGIIRKVSKFEEAK